MHTVVISKSQQPADPNSSLAILLKDMEKSLGMKSRVYSINVWTPNDKTKFVFRTTSKDLALKLCSFEWQVQYNLAVFIEEEISRVRCSEILLCFRAESNNSEEGVLVTKTYNENGHTVFTLAVAR